ncbi:E2-like enzyme [Sarracenia purpurea var. burkii]
MDKNFSSQLDRMKMLMVHRSDGEEESDEDAGVCSEVVKEEGNSESPCPLVCERKNKVVAVAATEGACSDVILSSSGDDEHGGDTGMDGEEASEDDAGVGEDEDEAGEEQGSAPLPLFQEDTLQSIYLVAHEPDDDNILRTRTYDVNITLV